MFCCCYPRPELRHINILQGCRVPPAKQNQAAEHTLHTLALPLYVYYIADSIYYAAGILQQTIYTLHTALLIYIEALTIN